MKSQDDAIVLGGAANSITIDPSYYNLGATVGDLLQLPVTTVSRILQVLLVPIP